MEDKPFHKYSNLESETRIFYKGDAKTKSCLGAIICELPNGYLVRMDNGHTYIVHPLVFEEFGGAFQVEEERQNKVSWLSVDNLGTVKDIGWGQYQISRMSFHPCMS